MYNPHVGYRGPDPATRSLTLELTERFGTPARTYEFVTGYKSASNVSGHCPDSNGITHGVDIFLTAPQMRWTADHLAARGKAGDRRVLYAIYADQIASASTGWQFMGSGWGHFDHVHLSVWDGYWGGPCTLPASIHGDTSSWGVAGTSPQSNDIIPLEEMDIDMATPDQVVDALLNRILEVDGQKARIQDWIVAIAKDSSKALKSGQIVKSFDGTEAPVHQVIANLGADVRAIKTATDKLPK